MMMNERNVGIGSIPTWKWPKRWCGVVSRRVCLARNRKNGIIYPSEVHL